MNDYKHLNITISQVEAIIAELVKTMKGTYEMEEKPNKLYQFKIIVPGQKEAILNVFDTRKGITVNPFVGKNQELSQQLAEAIRKSCKKVESAHQSFEGVFEELFEEFITEFREQDIKVKPVREDSHQQVMKLVAPNRHEVSITYYKNTHKVFIQGRTTKLYDDVILWFADKIIDEPSQIIEIVFSSMEEFCKYDVKFPDEVIENQLRREFGPLYEGNAVLEDAEKKWLKTSLFLLNLTKNLPEYYPVIAGSIKIIEGLLRRILIKRYGLQGAFKAKSKAFKHFCYNKTENKYTFKDEYADDFDLPHKEYIEELYNFIIGCRNKYMHDQGYSPYVIETREEAENIFNEVVRLIKEVEPFKEKLL